MLCQSQGNEERRLDYAQKVAMMYNSNAIALRFINWLSNYIFARWTVLSLARRTDRVNLWAGTNTGLVFG